MGMMFKYRTVIETESKRLGKDPLKIKGQIGLRACLIIGMIQPDTPDNPEEIRALKEAIQEVLGIAV